MRKRSRALLLATVALVVLLVWQLTGSDDASRKEGDRRAAPGAAVTAESETAAKKTAAYTSVLRGRVFDPTKHTVHKAEVSRLKPKPIDVVFTDEEGRYELPLLRPGRHLIEAAFGVDLAPRRVEIVAPKEGDPEEVDFHLAAGGFVFGELICRGKGVDRAELVLYRDGEEVAGAVSVDGFFVFEDEPLQGDLELGIEHPDAYLE